MIVETITAARSRAYALQASLVLWLSILLAVVNVNFFGQTLSFLFIPLIAIYLWPKEADIFLTYCFIFVAGLALDFLSGGPTGLWAIIFLVCYGILRPDQRGPELGLIETWLNFALWMSVVAAGFFLAKLIGAKRLALTPIFFMLAFNILIFPVLFHFRRVIRSVVVGDDN